MAQIRMTPEELRNAANFIREKEQAITTEVNSLKSKIDEVTSNWEGAAQSSFIETFEGNLYPVLRDTVPEVMQGLNAQLNGAADALEQADEQVAQAFRG